MINFIVTCILAENGIIYYDLKNKRWTNNNKVRNRIYEVIRINKK